jgi:hypothetical protein
LTLAGLAVVSSSVNKSAEDEAAGGACEDEDDDAGFLSGAPALWY